MNNGRAINNKQRGFTLLELLVVLAIIGAMVGAAIFFAAPSATEKARRLGGQTFDLMNKARVSAMLERRIYGLELLDDNPEETEIRLVVLASEVYGGGLYNSSAGIDSDGFDDFDSFDDFAHDRDSSLDDKEEGEAKITYADHIRKAQDLGLINWEGSPEWTELGDDDAVIIPGSVKLDFARETSLVDEARSAPPTEFPEEVADEEFPEEVEDIAPVVLFFPNGHLSNAGNFDFIGEAGDIVYGFSWNEEGDFERTDQE